MDIASMSIGMHQASLENAVSISVMKMSMDNSKIIGDKMTEMMDNMAVDVNLGNNLDVRV